MFTCMLGCYVASTQYPDLLESAGNVAGQMHEDKECPFSGVTSCGRGWRKVPESDAVGSLVVPMTAEGKPWVY